MLECHSLNSVKFHIQKVNTLATNMHTHSKPIHINGTNMENVCTISKLDRDFEMLNQNLSLYCSINFMLVLIKLSVTYHTHAHRRVCAAQRCMHGLIGKRRGGTTTRQLSTTDYVVVVFYDGLMLHFVHKCVDVCTKRENVKKKKKKPKLKTKMKQKTNKM